MGRRDLDGVAKFLPSVFPVPDFSVEFRQPGVVIKPHALGAVQVIGRGVWAFRGD